MNYNWKLWDNFEAAADELGLELRSRDGGCVYMGVPKEISEKFYVMCWTPLNKLSFIQHKQEKGPLDTFQITNLIDNFRQNHSDFHLEFGAKHTCNGGMYWFPGMFNSSTKDEIKQAVQIMMDTENFEKYRLLAVLRQESDE